MAKQKDNEYKLVVHEAEPKEVKNSKTGTAEIKYYETTTETLTPKIKKGEIIPFLQHLEQFLNRKYQMLDVITLPNAQNQHQSTFKFNIGFDHEDWIDTVAKGLKKKVKKQGHETKSHSYHVAFAIYNIDKNTPVFQQDFPQSTVVNATPIFQDFVFEKIVSMQQKMRVAVLRVLDVATDKNDPNNEKITPLYSHVFCSNMISGTPDMRGTGMYFRNGDKSRCTKLVINNKVRSVSGGGKSYFGNQAEAVAAINNVVEEISKRNRRKFKTNGK